MNLELTCSKIGFENCILKVCGIYVNWKYFFKQNISQDFPKIFRNNWNPLKSPKKIPFCDFETGVYLTCNQVFKLCEEVVPHQNTQTQNPKYPSPKYSAQNTQSPKYLRPNYPMSQNTQGQNTQDWNTVTNLIIKSVSTWMLNNYLIDILVMMLNIIAFYN